MKMDLPGMFLARKCLPRNLFSMKIDLPEMLLGRWCLTINDLPRMFIPRQFLPKRRVHLRHDLRFDLQFGACVGKNANAGTIS
jgi:hypothetical protein